MQPVIYDRTVSNINPKQAIFALSLVMVMNYVAIVTYPFLLRLLENMFHSDSAYFPFFLCMILSVAFTIFVFFLNTKPQDYDTMNIKLRWENLLKKEKINETKKTKKPFC